jgi:hypothetical protein
VQVSVVLDEILALEKSSCAVGGWMDLHRRLRCQPHPRAAPNADVLPQVIVAERPGSRRGKDHVQALTLGKPSSDAEWRLGVCRGQHGAAIAVEKAEIEPSVADDRG